MLKKDIKRFLEVMTGVSEVYGRKFTDSVMDIYFKSLAQYDIETVVTAISIHVKSPDNGQFFPKPADIIRMIGGSSQDCSHIAWSKVDKAVRRIGTHETVVFDDSMIHMVLSDMGGWVALGEKDDKEWPFVAKDFKERYHAYKSRQVVSVNYPGKLIGQHEANNGRKGFKVQDPVLIGDASKANAVLAGSESDGRLRIERHSEKKTAELITL